MDFVRRNFSTNEPLPVEHFLPHFLVGLLRQTGQKVRKKVFNWHRFICTEISSYKIHISIIYPNLTRLLIFPYLTISGFEALTKQHFRKVCVDGETFWTRAKLTNTKNHFTSILGQENLQ